MRQIALTWITQHGYAGLFSLLVLGIVGLPVPDEWLLTFSGFLVFNHTFQFIPAVLSGFLGSSCGISVSYTLGRFLGIRFLENHGRKFFIHREHVDRVLAWFGRFGHWTLLGGYFIPGVRHLTGYLAGASDFKLRHFTSFAFSGALLWSLTFVSAGYFLGEKWSEFSDSIHQTALITVAVAVALFILYLIVQRVRASR